MARQSLDAIRSQAWAILPSAAESLVERATRMRPVESAAFSIGGTESTTMQIVAGIAYIPITGALWPSANFWTKYGGDSSYEQIAADVRRAAADDGISRIVLLVDSPGGSVMGCEETAAVIKGAAGKKPVTAWVRGMCCSAAYWLASGANSIIATPSSSIGSIGAILMHMEASGFYEDIGVKFNVITFGKNKADGNQVEPLSDRARGNLQAYVDSYGKQFVARVAENRGKTPEAVVADYGDGRVFIAGEALARGLIDSVGGVELATSALPISSKHVVQFSKESSPMKYGQKLRALVFALGLCGAADAQAVQSAEDTQIAAWLDAHSAGLSALSEAEIMAKLRGQAPTQATAPAPAPVTAPAAQPAPAPTQAAPPAPAPVASQPVAPPVDTAAVAQAERERALDLTATGRALGVAAHDIESAIRSGEGYGATVARWTRARSETNPDVRGGGGQITPGSSEHDAFAAAATAALCLRANLVLTPEEARAAGDLRRASLIDLAARSLSLSGRQITLSTDREAMAEEALQMGGIGRQVFSSDGSRNRPSDFPNLFANLANKILDQGLVMAEVTYSRWTSRLQDLPDFKPATIVQAGDIGFLDMREDDDDMPTLSLSDELSGWLQADQYAGKVGLTVRMVMDDNLDGMTQSVLSLGMAHENTVNQLCVKLISGTPTLPGGSAVFSSGNSNLITSGAAGPSLTTAAAMRKLMRRQLAINGKTRINASPKIALVPPNWETDAEQTFLANLPHVAESVSNKNPFAGLVTPIVEPMLEDYSTTVWFLFADPRVRRFCCVAFLRGYGPGGKRVTWYNPDKGTRYFGLEGSFAAALAGPRGVVRNPGA